MTDPKTPAYPGWRASLRADAEAVGKRIPGQPASLAVGTIALLDYIENVAMPEYARQIDEISALERQIKEMKEEKMPNEHAPISLDEQILALTTERDRYKDALIAIRNSDGNNIEPMIEFMAKHGLDDAVEVVAEICSDADDFGRKFIDEVIKEAK